MSGHIDRFVKRDMRKDLYVDSAGIVWSGELVDSVLVGTSHIALPCEVELTEEQWERYCGARDGFGFEGVMK